jgi:hypothetical protein
MYHEEAAEELAEDIVRWVTRNSWRGSAFLEPEPTYNVNSQALMDHIISLGYDKSTVIEWIDNEADKVDAERKSNDTTDTRTS